MIYTGEVPPARAPPVENTMFEDLKNPQRAGGPGLGRNLFRFFPQVGDPKTRLYVYIGLLVLFALIAIGLRNYGKSYEARKQRREGPSEVLGISGDASRFAGAPDLDMRLAERITDMGPDARERWETDVIPYLLLEARHTPSVHAYSRDLLPLVPEVAPAIRKDSRPWRFQFVRFRGVIESIREETYEDVYGGKTEIGQIHRAIVVMGGGEGAVRLTVLYPFAPRWSDENEPTIHPEQHLITDGWIRGRGVFVKNFLDRAADGTPVETFLVVATAIERDFETLPVTSLEEIPFQIIEDDPSMQGDPQREPLLFRKYPRTLFRLLRWAEGRAGPAGAPQRAQDGLTALDFESQDYTELIGQAPRFRAKYFRGLGALVYPPSYYGPEQTEPNDAGVEEFLYGWIYTDRHHLIEYCAPASLAGEFKSNHRIRWEGYFYKARAYPSKGGTDRLAPMFVLTALEGVAPPATHSTEQIIIAAAFCVGIGLLVFLIVREDKTKSDFRRARKKTTVKA